MNQFFQYEEEGLHLHHVYADLVTSKGSSSMHAHDDYEIFYFISGDCTYNVKGNHYALKPGCLLLMRPAEVHCLIAGQDANYERIVVNFSHQLVAGIDPEGLLLQPFKQRLLGQLNLYKPGDFNESISRTLLQMVSQDRPFSSYERSVAVRVSLHQLLYEIREAFLRRSSLTDEASGRSDVDKLISFVNEHIADGLSLDSLADHFFLSKSQICRRFKQLTGTTLGSYIAAKRLIIAREQILTGKPAIEVSQKCGFHDYSVFYRAYRKKFGVSPVFQRRQPGQLLENILKVTL